MCGIVGIASTSQVESRTWLKLGRNALTHRGPDFGGEWFSADQSVGFAHQRLSIIDLSDKANQPMSDASEKFVIVFNGEIYNFQSLRKELQVDGAYFNSNSDTEVVLEAYKKWGAECLKHLNGMFAFAIYDFLKQILFLARDRAGEKPLYYYHEQGELRFASELKALFCDPSLPRRINLEAFDCYLKMGYVPGGLCMLQKFHKLPPAHALSFDLREGSIRLWRYWELPKFEADSAVAEEDLLDELEELLEDAVRRQMIADVPVGVLLSGGVDSSLVAAMAARASSHVKTFTISFPGHGKFDETEHARLISNYFGTDHTELEAKPTTVELLPRLARQFDEPVADSSIIPTHLVSELVRNHCTVALGGDGGDEMFGGYKHHSRLLWLHHNLGLLPTCWRRWIAQISEKSMPLGMVGRNWLKSLVVEMPFRIPLIAEHFGLKERRNLFANLTFSSDYAEVILQSRIPKDADILQRITRMDFLNYLAEDVLVKVDRSSMFNSLEVRAPMLDYRLIEFAFAKVPSSLKATMSSRKILLKRLASRLLPPEFDQKRKQGFSIPLSAWLKKKEFRQYFHEVLLDSGCTFKKTAVESLLKGQDLGFNNAERLFSLVLFELWRSEYSVSI